MSFNKLIKLASRFEKKYVVAQDLNAQIYNLAKPLLDELREYQYLESPTIYDIIRDNGALRAFEAFVQMISGIVDGSVADAMPADRANLSKLLAELPGQFSWTIRSLLASKDGSVDPAKLNQLVLLLQEYQPKFNSVTSSPGQAK